MLKRILNALLALLTTGKQLGLFKKGQTADIINSVKKKK